MSSEPDLASLITDFHEAAHAATDPIRKELYAMLLRLAKAVNTEFAQCVFGNGLMPLVIALA